MCRFVISILLYFYVVLFKRNVKTAFPCISSPFFIFNKLKNVKDIDLDSSFLGRNVLVSDGCKFFDRAIVFGNVKIGRYTSINGPSTRICSFINYVSIGSFCSIASNVIVQEYNHKYHRASTYNIFSHFFEKTTSLLDYESKGPIIIEDDVWIGSNCTILSGVKIGRGSIIGAGSVVVSDIPPYSIAVGNPACVVKTRFCKETIDFLERSHWWEWSIEKIKTERDFFLKDLY